MSTLKLSLELEVTPGNEASLKDLLGCVAMMAANSCPNARTRSRSAKPAAPQDEPKPEPMPEPMPASSSPDSNLNPVEFEARQGGGPLPTYTQLPKQEKPKYTVEWVRRLLAEKVGKYRAECKQKLSELGAANVSSLDPEKYAEFVDFLNTLNV